MRSGTILSPALAVRSPCHDSRAPQTHRRAEGGLQRSAGHQTRLVLFERAAARGLHKRFGSQEACRAAVIACVIRLFDAHIRMRGYSDAIDIAPMGAADRLGDGYGRGIVGH